MSDATDAAFFRECLDAGARVAAARRGAGATCGDAVDAALHAFLAEALGGERHLWLLEYLNQVADATPVPVAPEVYTGHGLWITRKLNDTATGKSKYVVICNCGWQSPSRSRGAAARADLQLHVVDEAVA